MNTPQGDPATADLDTVRSWLNSLYGGLPGWISICSPADYWKGRRFTTDPTGIEQAVTRVAELDQQSAKGIYAQVTTLSQQPATGRGGEDLAHAMRGLWSDLDFGTTGHKPSADGLPLPPDEEAVLQVVAESGLPEPTGIIWSGYGAYAWWWLDEPHVIGDDRDHIKQLTTDWQTILAATALKHGWSHDTGVANLDRLLRIPGTVNRKAGGEKISTIGGEGSGALYTLDGLRKAAADHALAAREVLAQAEAARRPAFQQAAAPSRPLPGQRTAGTGPFDVLQEMAKWGDVLAGTGWVYVGQHGDGREKWKRDPQAESEYSALCSYDPPVMVVFSSAAGLEPGALPPGHKHTMGRVFAHFHYGDDVVEAGRDLMRAAAGKTTRPAASCIPRNILDAIKQRCQHDPYRPNLQLVAGARTSQPPQPPVDGTAALKVNENGSASEQQDYYTKTDDGNALRLVDTHGDGIRYCPQRGWLTWDGHRWAWDERGLVAELARDIARSLPEGEGEAQHKMRSLSARGLDAMLKVARTDPRIVAPLACLDANPWQINTPDGVIDLRTGQLSAPDPAALHTRSTLVAPDFEKPAERFQEFLVDTFGSDAELVTYVQRLLGLSLIGTVLEQILPFAFGEGANGKSTLADTVMRIVGFGETGYSMSAPSEMLLASAANSHPTEIARLAGARLVVASELDDGQRFAEARIKMLTGRDIITGRFMRQDFFSFAPTHTLWLLGNHQPQVRTGGPAFWRRLRLVPFLHTVPEDKRDPNLEERLVDHEGPSILAWLIRGATEYVRQGLPTPESVRVATAAYQGDQDTVARFVADMCTLGAPGAQLMQTPSAALRAAYERWCHQEGEEPVSQKKMASLLQKPPHNVQASRNSRFRFFDGIRLNDSGEPSGDAESGW